MNLSKIVSPEGVEIEVIDYAHPHYVIGTAGNVVWLPKIREEVEQLKISHRAPGLVVREGREIVM